MPSFLEHRFSKQIGTIFLLFFIGILFSGFLLFIPGFGTIDILGTSSSEEATSPRFMKLYLALSHVMGFILPAWFFGVLFYPKTIKSFFKIDKYPLSIIAALSLIFLFASYPIIGFSSELNMHIPIGPELTSLESNSLMALQKILSMHHLGDLLVNLIIIAVIPALGEEFLFRGVIQQLLAKRFNRPILAIWIAAILFSALHLQAGSFFPKMALGICFGYLFYLTGNLWISILAHFANNALQVISLYIIPKDMATSMIENNKPENLQLIPWWVIIISIILLYFLSELIKKMVKEEHV